MSADLFRPAEDNELGVLASFHYWQRYDLVKEIEKLPRRIKVFTDSGGFSAASQGATVSLDDYVKFVKKISPVCTAYANLDVIGDYRATRLNQLRMERAGLRPMPVVHMGTDVEEIRWYADRGYTYQALGGFVPNTVLLIAGLNAIGKGKCPSKVIPPKLHRSAYETIKWVDEASAVAKECGVQLHAFGVTYWPNILRWRWFSVDSSTWVSGARFGSMAIFDPDKMDWINGLHRTDADTMMPLAPLLRKYGCSVTSLLCDTKYSVDRLMTVQGRSWIVTMRRLKDYGINLNMYFALIGPAQLVPFYGFFKEWTP